MVSDDWSPSRYLRFADERTRAARDLLARVPLERARSIVDVGCGPGTSTALLTERHPEADVLGIDSSPAMLEVARRAVPQARFALADASRWLPAPDTDLVFANATYQWIPDHLALLPQVLGALRPGAVLAVQMPDNLAEPTHAWMVRVAGEGPWAERLARAERPPLPPVRAYYAALAPLAARLDLWQTVYHHVLDGPDAIVEWVRGTGLRPFLAPLEPAEREAFLSRYRAGIAQAYPPAGDGRVLLRFPRLFIVASR